MSGDNIREDGLPWLFLCHGAANVGQISNDAARELVREEKVRIAYIAAAGAHNEGFLKPFRSGRAIVCIDGCPIKCASKTLEHAGILVRKEITVTLMGIRKTSDLNYVPERVMELKAKLENEIFSL